MIIDQLLERLERFSGREAIIWNATAYSYDWLLQEVRREQEALSQPGIGPGAVVVLEGDGMPSACALLLALLNNRNIVVPLLSALPEPEKAEQVTIAQGEYRIRVEASARCQVDRVGQTATDELIQRLRREGHPGLVLFTSGSTGASKAVLHDTERLLAKFLKAETVLRTVAFLLFDHMAGLDTLFYAFASGSTLIGCPDRSPQAVCQLIAQTRAELLPATPTFLRLLLLSEAWRQADLSSLKVIAYGSEPMPASTLQRLAEVFQGVQLIQKYGMCEWGSPRSKSKSRDSLWVRLNGEGLQTKVVNGTLWVKAESAMLGYLNAPSPFDAEGWLNTGDQVEVEGEYLRILGRKSELINVGGSKVYPAEVESVLLELDNIAGAVVTGEPHAIMGQIVVAKVSLKHAEDPEAVKHRIQQACRQRLAPYKIPVKVQVVETEPITLRFKQVRR